MGLIRGVARTAAIAGTATAVSNRVSRRQAGRWGRRDAASSPPPDQPPAQYPPAPPVDPAEQRLARLRELGDLHDRGVLTDAEFAAQKQRLLAM
jgi:hypothetical protein